MKYTYLQFVVGFFVAILALFISLVSVPHMGVVGFTLSIEAFFLMSVALINLLAVFIRLFKTMPIVERENKQMLIDNNQLKTDLGIPFHVF